MRTPKNQNLRTHDQSEAGLSAGAMPKPRGGAGIRLPVPGALFHVVL